MFCKNCGNPVDDTALFCTKCGTPVNRTANSQPQSTSYTAPQNTSYAAPQNTSYAVPSSPPVKRLPNSCPVCNSSIRPLTAELYACDICGSEFQTDGNKNIISERLEPIAIYRDILKAAEFGDKGKYRQELQCLTNAINRSPGNVAVLIKLGRAYRRNKMLPQALDCYQRAISYNPNYVTAYSNIGAVYITSQQYAQAEPYYRKAIELVEKNRDCCTPNDYATIYGNAAIALGKLGKRQEALEMLAIAERNGYPNGRTVRDMAGLW